MQLRVQNAGWSADVERWESDEDSEDSEDELLATKHDDRVETLLVSDAGMLRLIA